jgi:hypothetical protein
MKVYIGPYVNYFGPFQLADLLQHIGVPARWCYAIGEKISCLPFVNQFAEWVHKKRKRKVEVKIHDYDTWNMDHTLAYIILPMLKKLKAEKHGSCPVDNEDVPEYLHSVNSTDQEDGTVQARWEYVLDEMIWAFENIIQENLNAYWNEETQEVDIESWKTYSDRISNGTRLFGKYYMGLWD